MYIDFYFRDEGVVLKDLGSKWTPNKRDDRWLKIKPDYLNLGADLDLLIIGITTSSPCNFVSFDLMLVAFFYNLI